MARKSIRGRAKRKACVKCKAIVAYNVNKCPVCGSREFSEDFIGEIVIIDPENSEMAKKINISVKGIFALKVRY